MWEKNRKGDVIVKSTSNPINLIHELSHAYHFSLPINFSKRWYNEVGVKRKKNSDYQDRNLCLEFGTFSLYSNFNALIDSDLEHWKYEPDYPIPDFIEKINNLTFKYYNKIPNSDELFFLDEHLNLLGQKLKSTNIDIYVDPNFKYTGHFEYDEKNSDKYFEMISEDVANSVDKLLDLYLNPKQVGNLFVAKQLWEHDLSKKRLHLLYESDFISEKVFNTLNSKEWLKPIYQNYLDNGLPKYYP